MFPTLLHFFWLSIQTFTAFSLVVPAILCLLYFARRFFKKQPVFHDELHEEKDYAIIVSVCDPLQSIQTTLQSLLQLQYSNYIVYVVGNYSATTGISLHNDRIVYLRSTAAYHSHTRQHRFAIESFKRPHTHVAFLDGDSLVETDYLTNLNTFFNEGYQAVTSRRSLQNNKSVGNALQTIADLYHNFFSGEVLFSLGSSSVLSLTGTAFSVSFYKQRLKQMKVNSADFIFNLQTATIQSGRQVAFASGAVVYNIADTSYYQLMRQHAQHIHDWLFGLLSNGKMAAKGLLLGDINQLLYGLLALRLPLSTGTFVGVACLAVNIKIDPSAASLWIGIFFLLPAYLLIAATQSHVYKQQSETKKYSTDYLFETLYLPEEKNDYDVMMRTV